MNSEDLLNAKLEELKKWRDNDVYEQIYVYNFSEAVMYHIEMG